MSAVLGPDGIVAINFAGRIDSMAFEIVIHTMLNAFNHCRAFEDGPRSESREDDYKNMIILCSNSSPIKFRVPLQSDFLPYPSPSLRRSVLTTFNQNEFDLTKYSKRDHKVGGKEVELLTDKTTMILDEAQIGGTFEHFEAMSEVMDTKTWNMY